MRKPNIKKIKCPIFHSRNEEVEGLVTAINAVEDVGKKAQFAKRIIEEAKRFLSCKHFDTKRAECEICHSIAILRVETARLVIRAKDLKTNK